MKILIVKSARDSFEKMINSWFENEKIDVMSLDTEYSGLNKRKYYCSQFRKFSKLRYDKVIVFDNCAAFILAHFYFKHPYLWLWNTVLNRRMDYFRIRLCSLMNYKMYSFDEGECAKFNLSFNTQFFCKDLERRKSDYDLYFVGTDKGRYNLVKKTYEYATTHGLKPVFQMIPDKEKKYELREIIKEDFVEYNEVLTNVASSKAVLDIAKPGQTGMTFRAMEALFYDKKIITNNPHYVELPFYRKEAVFIANNDLNGLEEFIDAPEIKYDDAIKKYYNIENWLSRFI